MKNNLYVFFLFFITGLMSCSHHSGLYEHAEKIMSQHPDSVLTYIIHSGFISGYQNRYGDNLKPPTNVYHRMTA